MVHTVWTIQYGPYCMDHVVETTNICSFMILKTTRFENQFHSTIESIPYFVEQEHKHLNMAKEGVGKI